MKKILVLGCTGMLGFQVLNKLQELNNTKIYVTYRNKKDVNFINKKKIQLIKFNAKNPKNLGKYNFDFVINCIGIIKPYIIENDSDSVLQAININSIFPWKLANIFKNKKTKIYQIATDCVFSGIRGDYVESDIHDCNDVYGKTKSLGEIRSFNFYNIRCSIIGPEIKNKLSLLEWFKKNPLNQKLNGFKNHSWNGITTKAFGEVIKTIIKKNITIPNNLHLLPKDKVSKYKLLKIFQLKFKRKDLIINCISANQSINRTLKTNHEKINQKIWKHTCYKKIPTINELVMEL